MLTLLLTALALLGAAVLLGTVLAVLHLLPQRPAIPSWLSALHGLLATAGFVVLVLALRGPARGAASGAGSFGLIAAGLAAAALIAGVAILAARLRKKPFTGFLVGGHATLAVSAFVILAAYVFA
ncbi:MAG: hypothetical protein JO128_18035 [Alphaproteobacteria bacterium]|nr:hypothetical protein [Alphaproteobacteria bacterium]